jgi:hypothetical protein
VPKFIDAVIAKTSTKRSFSVIENERFGIVFAKTGSIISDTVLFVMNFLLTKISTAMEKALHFYTLTCFYLDMCVKMDTNVQFCVLSNFLTVNTE